MNFVADMETKQVEFQEVLCFTFVAAAHKRNVLILTEPRGRNLNFVNRTSESTCSGRCRTATMTKAVNKGRGQSANREVKSETTKHRKVTTSLQHTPSSSGLLFSILSILHAFLSSTSHPLLSLSFPFVPLSV